MLAALRHVMRCLGRLPRPRGRTAEPPQARLRRACERASRARERASLLVSAALRSDRGATRARRERRRRRCRPTRRTRARARRTTSGRETGKPETTLTSRPMPLPRITPSTPPTLVSTTASIRNWIEDFPPPRADGLADANLARALGHRDRHDRHHPDAADHQRDRRDHDEREQDRARDLIPHREDRVGGDEVEVVRLVERQPVPDAHDALDLAHRVFAGRRLVRARSAIIAAGAAERPGARRVSEPNCLRYAV